MFSGRADCIESTPCTSKRSGSVIAARGCAVVDESYPAVENFVACTPVEIVYRGVRVIWTVCTIYTAPKTTGF